MPAGSNVKPLSLREVMWAAGFWEGEGSVGRRMVNAAQKNPWPLERLQRSFGGKIALNANEKRRDSFWYQWHLCGPNARQFVSLIYPHLSPRRQAQIDAKFLTEAKLKHKKLRPPPIHSFQQLRLVKEA